MLIVVLPILTDEVIKGAADKVMGVHCSRPASVVEGITPKLSSVPIMLHSIITCNITHLTVKSLTNTGGKISEVVLYQVVNWLCTDDCCGAFTSWSLSGDCGTIDWNQQFIYMKLHSSFVSTPITKLPYN